MEVVFRCRLVRFRKVLTGGRGGFLEFCNMNLKELDLSDNFIEDIKDGGDLKRKLIFAGFERLSVLGQLELLRLDWNSFNNSILPSLGVLSSLKTLSLHGNLLNGSIDIGGVCSAKRSVVSDRVLFGKEEVSDLSSMGALGYGWLKIRRMYEAWVFGVGHGW
ncbi:hypothetical protein TEA_009313 [Camellia sinensis var. sinensis]|uniref:Leucine-rich repeat-containing N-terminal plant-type domain-containing protein n=1 Tax=Camellia sinensis var. sinensis TaxID=542762 RepID=A0A4S4DJT3_CAMSN|nr:hypothetical protein TEA_009313 [Camellia sinensis var. sinensis]